MKETNLNIPSTHDSVDSSNIDDIISLSQKYNMMVNDEDIAQKQSYYVSEIETKKMLLSKNALSENIDRIPFRFRSEQFNSLNELSEIMSFDEVTRNTVHSILVKYLNYPKIISLLFELIVEISYCSDGAASYDFDKIKRALNIFERDDVFEVIKSTENNFGGNEAHLVSRISELRKYFLDECGEDYFELIKTYQVAPMVIEIFSRNVQGYFRNDFDFEEQTGLRDKKTNSLSSDRVRMKILAPFYKNSDTNNKIINKYNRLYFFLPEIKKLLLAKDLTGLKEYSILKKIDYPSDSENKDLDSVLQNYTIFMNFECFLNAHNKTYDWIENSLFKDAYDDRLLTKNDKDALYRRLNEEVGLIKDAFKKYFMAKLEVPRVEINNEKKVREYIYSILNDKSVKLTLNWEKGIANFESKYGSGTIKLISEDLLNTKLHKLIDEESESFDLKKYIFKLQREYFNIKLE